MDKIEPLCYNLEDEEFQLVFGDKKEASRFTGGDFGELALPKVTYHISSYAGMRPGRSLAEAMYRCLHEPSTFNHNRIHGSTTFFQYVSLLDGKFIIKSSRRSHNTENLPNMPTVEDLQEAFLKIDRNYFRFSKGSNLQKLLVAVLGGKARDPDVAFEALVS